MFSLRYGLLCVNNSCRNEEALRGVIIMKGPPSVDRQTDRICRSVGLSVKHPRTRLVTKSKSVGFAGLSPWWASTGFNMFCHLVCLVSLYVVSSPFCRKGRFSDTIFGNLMFSKSRKALNSGTFYEVGWQDWLITLNSKTYERSI